MRPLFCTLARLTDTIESPLPFTNNPSILSEIFARGSMNTIGLRVDNQFLAHALRPGTTHHHAYLLHAAVRKLTGNPIDASSVDRVAVIFGGFYAPFPTTFGVMFDRGFVNPAPDDPNPDPNLVGPPREGCAVFLGAIRQKRADPLQYARQILFSTVHELGHVFNLQHIEEPKNYLATSSGLATYPNNAFEFLPFHKQVLHEAANLKEIWPGGSPFSDTGQIGHYDETWSARTATKSTLELSLDMTKRSFYSFEPIELDIILSVRKGTNRQQKIENCLDPGYTNFRIWIEDPSGERRRYRPVRLYCRTGDKVTIGPKTPFRRDISIFGESGGYTFRIAGVHKLWAELAVSPQKKLQSEKLEIEIRSIRTPSSQFMAAAKLFKSIHGRTLCYHRIDNSRGRALKAFEDFLAGGSTKELKGLIRYSMARAYMNQFGRKLDERRVSKRLRRARDLFKFSVQNPDLGTHQRDIANKFLREAFNER